MPRPHSDQLNQNHWCCEKASVFFKPPTKCSIQQRVRICPRAGELNLWSKDLQHRLVRNAEPQLPCKPNVSLLICISAPSPGDSYALKSLRALLQSTILTILNPYIQLLLKPIPIAWHFHCMKDIWLLYKWAGERKLPFKQGSLIQSITCA